MWIAPIPGTTKLHRLKENVDGAGIELTADNLRDIDARLANITAQGERYPAHLQARVASYVYRLNAQVGGGKESMRTVIVVIGPGSIGQAIARRVGAGKRLLLADLREENADSAARTLSEAGFDVTTAVVDVSSRASVEALVAKATSLGTVQGLIHAAGVSPSQASPGTILKVDLYGTALVLEKFGEVIAEGGSAVVIAS